MAYLFHDGFETGGADLWDSVTGAPSFVVGAANTGNYGMRCNASGSGIYADISTSITTAKRVSFYLYINSAPVGANTWIVGGLAGDGNTNLRLTTDRYLKVFSGATEQFTSSIQLSTGQWYRIALSLDATNFDCKLYIDGVERGTDNETSTYYQNIVALVGTISATTADLYFDDIVFDDTSSTADLGNIKVLAARPTAQGTDDDAAFQQYTGGATTANDAIYTDIDDDPPDANTGVWAEADGTANYWSVQLDNCGSGNLSGIGASDTIEAVNFLYYYKTDAGGANEYWIYGRDTSGRSSDIALDDPKDPTWVAQYQTTSWDDDASAWSQSEFADQEMGMMCDDAVKDMYWFEAYAMVAYIPVVTTTDINVNDANPDVTDNSDQYITPYLINQNDANPDVTDESQQYITPYLVNQADENPNVTDYANVAIDVIPEQYEYTGFNYPHGTIIQGGYLYAVTATSPSKLLKINLSDLSDFTSITFPSDGNHNSITQIVYSASKNKLYCCSSLNKVYVIEIDPDTLAYSTVIDDSSYAYVSAFIQDETYFYCATESNFVKYSMSSWTESTNSSHSFAVNSMIINSGYLYGGFASTPSGIVKIDITDLSYSSQTFASGYNFGADDIAFAGGYVFIGMEFGSNQGDIAKVDISDLSVTYINIGHSRASYSIQYDGTSIWSVYPSGVLAKINPSTNEYDLYDCELIGANEILFINDKIYLTSFEVDLDVLKTKESLLKYASIPFESISVSDGIQQYITPYIINQNEQITITDEVFVSLSLSINVNDNIALQEDAQQYLTIYEINEYADINIQDYSNVTRVEAAILNIDMADANPDVSDESIQYINPYLINIADDLQVQDISSQYLTIYEINVSDDISLTDVSQQYLTIYEINVADDIAIQDVSSQYLTIYEINDADDLTVTDYSDAAIQAAASVNINVADTNPDVSDISQQYVTPYLISVNDNIDLQDSSSQYLDIYEISVADDIGVADASIQILTPYLINQYEQTDVNDFSNQYLTTYEIYVSDDLTITDSTSQYLTSYLINVWDSIDLTDASSQNLTIYEINQSDSVTIQENAALELSYYEINVFDSINVSEDASVFVTAAGIVYVNVSDDIGLQDISDTQISPYLVSVSDDLAITDSTSQYLTNYLISQFDSIDVQEDVSITIIGVGIQSINVFDDLAITDATQQYLDLYQINENENLSIQDATSNAFDLFLISENENIAVSDSINAQLTPYLITEYDSIEVTEYNDQIIALKSRLVDVNESISLSDYGLASIAVYPFLQAFLTINTTNSIIDVDKTMSELDVEETETIISVTR